MFGALGKLGNLEILNDIGGVASQVGKGIRVLSQINSVIGSGSGSGVVQGITGPISVPGFIQMGAEAGANAVAEILDAGGVVREYIDKIDPVALNGLRSQFGTLYDTVKNGKLDIKTVATSLQTLLAAEKNIQRQVDAFFGTENPLDVVGNGGPILSSCNMATPYAAVLAAEYAPKYKFLFIVEFEFEPDVLVALGEQGSAVARKAAFMIKSATRPTYNVQYEETNCYGYKSAVPKSTTFDPCTFVMYDDQQDAALRFHELVTRILIPSTTVVPTSHKLYENFPFGQPKSASKSSIGSVGLAGALGNNVSALGSISGGGLSGLAGSLSSSLGGAVGGGLQSAAFSAIGPNLLGQAVGNIAANYAQSAINKVVDKAVTTATDFVNSAVDTVTSKALSAVAGLPEIPGIPGVFDVNGVVQSYVAGQVLGAASSAKDKISSIAGGGAETLVSTPNNDFQGGPSDQFASASSGPAAPRQVVESLANGGLSVRTTGIVKTSPYKGHGTYAGATVSDLPNEARTLFKSIKLHHIYDFGVSSSTYTFIEPQITSFELSALDMADSEPCEITMQFRYGTMRQQIGIPYKPGGGPSRHNGEAPDYAYQIARASHIDTASTDGSQKMQELGTLRT